MPKRKATAAKRKGPAKAATTKGASQSRTKQTDTAMPPAIVDSEGSDDDRDVIPARASTKKADPAVDEPEDEEAGEEDDDDEEGEFVVEKLITHAFDVDTGELKYEVKWLGWDKKSDNTWEPIENLSSATDALNKYHAKIGGVPVWEPATKGKKKGNKRGAAGDTNPKSSKKVRASNGEVKAQLPQGSWEQHVIRVVNIVNEFEADEVAGKPTPRYKGMIEWNNGLNRSQHALNTLRSKCPQKLLDYYEAHLKFTTTDPTEGDEAADEEV